MSRYTLASGGPAKRRGSSGSRRGRRRCDAWPSARSRTVASPPTSGWPPEPGPRTTRCGTVAPVPRGAHPQPQCARRREPSTKYGVAPTRSSRHSTEPVFARRHGAGCHPSPRSLGHGGRDRRGPRRPARSGHRPRAGPRAELHVGRRSAHRSAGGNAGVTRALRRRDAADSSGATSCVPAANARRIRTCAAARRTARAGDAFDDDLRQVLAATRGRRGRRAGRRARGRRQPASRLPRQSMTSGRRPRRPSRGAEEAPRRWRRRPRTPGANRTAACQRSRSSHSSGATLTICIGTCRERPTANVVVAEHAEAGDELGDRREVGRARQAPNNGVNCSSAGAELDLLGQVQVPRLVDVHPRRRLSRTHLEQDGIAPLLLEEAVRISSASSPQIARGRLRDELESDAPAQREEVLGDDDVRRIGVSTAIGRRGTSRPGSAVSYPGHQASATGGDALQAAVAVGVGELHDVDDRRPGRRLARTATSPSLPAFGGCDDEQTSRARLAGCRSTMALAQGLPHACRSRSRPARLDENPPETSNTRTGVLAACRPPRRQPASTSCSIAPAACAERSASQSSPPELLASAFGSARPRSSALGRRTSQDVALGGSIRS